MEAEQFMQEFQSKEINMELELMEKIISVLLPLISLSVVYWLYQYLSRRINIRDYEWEGMDLLCNDIKIILFNFDKNTVENKNNKFIKTPNNKIYFKVFVQIFKEGLREYIEINPKDRSTFDKDLIILVNKKDICFTDNLRFILWFWWRILLDKWTKNRNKKLPNFIVKTYVLPNEFLINIDKLCK